MSVSESCNGCEYQHRSVGNEPCYGCDKHSNYIERKERTFDDLVVALERIAYSLEGMEGVG